MSRRCLCGHNEIQHSAIFGLCKGVPAQWPGREIAGMQGLCGCVAYFPQPRVRIGWRERVGLFMRSVLS